MTFSPKTHSQQDLETSTSSSRHTLEEKILSVTHNEIPDEYDTFSEPSICKEPVTLKDYKKGSLSDYKWKQLEASPLFKKIFTSHKEEFKEIIQETPSILIKGFSMRNTESLENALRIRDDERQR